MTLAPDLGERLNKYALVVPNHSVIRLNGRDRYADGRRTRLSTAEGNVRKQ